MEKQPNYIVFLCYGYDRVFYECAYALLSLSELYAPANISDTEIWIYTDKPEWFKQFKDCPLNLKFREIDMETIKKWRGSIDFVHRVKIEILKDFTKNKRGNILYLDTDVVFTHRIDKMLHDINEGKLYMHIREGRVSDAGNPILKKLNNFLVANNNPKLNNTPINEMDMWNAGVLGFNTRHIGLLDEVLDFTDREYPKFPKHVVEQFAFSVYFQFTANIKAAAPYIFHYWNLKEAGNVLSSFLNHFSGNKWEDLVHYSKLIRIETLMQEKVVFLSNRGVSGIIAGKKWEPPKYDWPQLLKQL